MNLLGNLGKTLLFWQLVKTTQCQHLGKCEHIVAVGKMNMKAPLLTLPAFICYL
jgi:hypothetical protein